MKVSWDDCGLEAKAMALAYDQVATHDEQEREAALAGVKLNRI